MGHTTGVGRAAACLWHTDGRQHDAADRLQNANANGACVTASVRGEPSPPHSRRARRSGVAGRPSNPRTTRSGFLDEPGK